MMNTIPQHALKVTTVGTHIRTGEPFWCRLEPKRSALCTARLWTCPGYTSEERRPEWEHPLLVQSHHECGSSGSQNQAGIICQLSFLRSWSQAYRCWMIGGSITEQHTTGKLKIMKRFSSLTNLLGKISFSPSEFVKEEEPLIISCLHLEQTSTFTGQMSGWKFQRNN